MSDKITTEQALQTLIALHDREAAGDETITLKEWQNAINASKKALNIK